MGYRARRFVRSQFVDDLKVFAVLAAFMAVIVYADYIGRGGL